jgi:hypothetical protein
MLNTIPVGRLHDTQRVWPTARTEAQHATVEEIVTALNFDFACHNPFDFEVARSGYSGAFWFQYYTTDGELHFRELGPTGNTLMHIHR